MQKRRWFRRSSLLPVVLLLIGCGSDGDDSSGEASSWTDPDDDGGSTGGRPNESESPPSLSIPNDSGEAPALAPEILTLSYIGGSGDQFLRTLEVTDRGEVIVGGRGFELRYDIESGESESAGDLSTHDDDDYDGRPRLPRDPGDAFEDPRSGLTFTVGFRQSNQLQIPIFRAFQEEERIWLLWGHAAQDIQNADLGADSRCYQMWAMPNGRLGVQCWTDGGNSVLARAPRDLAESAAWPREDAYQRSAGGMSSMYALVNPADGGSVESGTFVAEHVSPLAVDPWGRVYVAHTARSRSRSLGPDNPFGQSEDSNAGFFVLGSDLNAPIFNARIGGSPTEGGRQRFGHIVLRDNILVLAGTTSAPILNAVRPFQDEHGGGQDGLLAIVRLW